MMMADAMIQIHAQYKASRLYEAAPAINRPRTSLPKITSNPAIMGDRQGGVKRGNSFIVGQKLRESKWFRQDETKIVCAVFESGFIVEKQEDGQENAYGVVMWVPGHEKSKDPHYMTIYTLVGAREKYKLQAFNLSEFWTEGSAIRINNKNDKTDAPNNDEAIRMQIKSAEKRRFHNTEHFAYFCRYEKPELPRTKKFTEMKWSPSSILAKIRTFSVK